MVRTDESGTAVTYESYLKASATGLARAGKGGCATVAQVPANVSSVRFWNEQLCLRCR